MRSISLSLLSALVCVLAACGISSVPAVTIAPAFPTPAARFEFAADSSAVQQVPQPVTSVLPAEVAVPVTLSYRNATGYNAQQHFALRSAPPLEGEDGAGAYEGYEYWAAEPDEVVFLSEDQLVFLGDMYVRPLSELAPGVAAILQESGGSVTAAVVVPQYRTIYVANPEVALPMASVVKLIIMLAVLDRAESEGRTVTSEEVALLDPMVTWSDNDSATWLWDGLGGGAGIDAYLQRAGVGGIATDPWAWGDSRASGAAVALLLSRLAFLDLVTPEHRALALNLLAHVSQDQRWGVGGSLSAPEGAVVGVKDGWYPVAQGWRVGSAGVVVPGADAPAGAVAYSIAVLTAQNDTLEGGIATIQRIADLVHAALYPEYVAVLP